MTTVLRQMSEEPGLWSRILSGRRIIIGIVWFGALLMGVMWGAVVTVVRVDQENAIAAEVARNETLANALDEYAARVIDESDQVVRSLIRESARGGKSVDLAEFVLTNAIHADVVSTVALSDEHGTGLSIALAEKSAYPSNFAERDYFRIHVKKDAAGLFIGKPEAERTTGHDLIPLTRRIDKADGTFGGVAMVFVRPASLTAILQGAVMRPMDTIALIGLDGITRARLTKTSSSSGQDVGKSPILFAQIQQPAGNILARGPLDGTPKFFSYRSLRKYPIIALVGRPEADVLAATNQRKTRMFWGAGLMSTVIVGFTILLLVALGSQRRAVAGIARSDARSLGLLTVCPDGIWIHRDGEIHYVNDALVKMLDYERPDDLIGKQIYASMHQNMRDVMRAQVAAIEATRSASPIAEGVMLRRDGTSLDVELSAASYVLDGVPWTISIIRDIAERKNSQVRIAQVNRVHAVLSGILALIVRVRERNELFQEACRIAVEQGGFRMSLIAIVNGNEKTIVPVASAGKDDGLMSSIKEVLASSAGASTTMVARAISEKKAIVSNNSRNDTRVLFGKNYIDSGVQSMAVLPLIVSDVAVGVLALYASEIDFFHEQELKLLMELAHDIAFAIDHLEKEQRLDYLAFYDQLTGLANRTLFLERVAQYVRSAESMPHKVAIAVLDLARFKNVNDSLGRPAGDALLRQVAQWLTLHSGDVNLLARIDADHFAVVLPQVHTDGNLAGLVENSMVAFAAHSFRVEDNVLRLAFRAGVALYPDDGVDADTVFRRAEGALIRAKAQGETYLFYEQTMTDSLSSRLSLENQLRQALDREEFVLHYQPKVDLASGKLTGAEALIRWNDPQTGLVAPSHFIPILEETGLILEVGRWALKKAMSDYLRWHAAGLPAVRIAVNVSPLQLRHRDFIAGIEHLLSTDTRAPHGLELEITESVIMEDVKNTIASLSAIRAQGVRIAIDDFGTGFSSLSYLAKLPVDTLKIDRTFVMEMTVTPQGLALVSTIIKLAHSLQLKVVAEGVETEEQSNLLRLLSCDEMQGFLFSKPVPADVFEARFLTS